MTFGAAAFVREFPVDGAVGVVDQQDLSVEIARRAAGPCLEDGKDLGHLVIECQVPFPWDPCGRA